ncbi:hypothetical protein BX600DRAFT_519227 [Xylariales sp. PMI_506]|nr:hypothetical protein BX600DRAFT_519227 [Xylariales sp. PMI_506]
MDSDNESDFYGDEETIDQLNLRVEQFDLDEWWSWHSILQTPLRIQSHAQTHTDLTHLHNPYAGVPYAWQLTETVDAFLDRLPPATTTESSIGPWIFVCNPYISRKDLAKAQSQSIRGSENEAPEEDGTELLRFVEGGMERLHFVTGFLDQINGAVMKPLVRSQEKNIAAAEAARDIQQLAYACHVKAGKWLLFCPAASVDELWASVARATVNNELGVAAKVSTRGEDDQQRTERIICIYTADFTDKADVKRVAAKLRQLGLIQAKGRPLYYKPDAYTYLGIGSGNAWGIKASIYNTKDILD